MTRPATLIRYLVHGSRVDRWIDEHVKDKGPSTTRIAAPRSAGVDHVGKYLKRDWRDAIAHVEHKSRVNPDDLKTRMRIHQDLPIVRDLARAMIRSDLLD